MIAALVSRLSPQRAVPPASTRLEVCPPSLLPGEAPRWQRALRRAVGRRAGAASATMNEALQAARQDFAACLDGVEGQHADFLRARGLRARSLLDLWHLRAELFSLVAVQRSQHEAMLRLAGLNAHFPTRSPRSGFAPADF